MDCDTALSTEIENAFGPELADALYDCGFIRSIEQTYKQLQESPARRALRGFLMDVFLPDLQKAYERGELPGVARNVLWVLRRLLSSRSVLIAFTDPKQHWLIEELERDLMRDLKRETFPYSVAKMWVDGEGKIPINQVVLLAYCQDFGIIQQTEKEMRIALKLFERTIAPYLRALGKTRKEQRRAAEELLKQEEEEHPFSLLVYNGESFTRELLVFLLATRLLEGKN